MKDSKHLTIDPLILDTLNLNQQRVKHILNIIRGSQKYSIAKTQRKVNSNSYHYQTIASLDNQTSVLPIILPTTRNTNTISRRQIAAKGEAKLNQSGQNPRMSFHNSNPNHAQTERTIVAKMKTNRYQKSPKNQRMTKEQRPVKEEVLDLQQQMLSLHKDKKMQLMKDYMRRKLKKSKSQQINPKDLYRFEIETIIGELTPIELLQQSQSRMRRLKKRHKHLSTFDKDYYTKLNQHDMLILF